MTTLHVLAAATASSSSAAACFCFSSAHPTYEEGVLTFGSPQALACEENHATDVRCASHSPHRCSLRRGHHLQRQTTTTTRTMTPFSIWTPRRCVHDAPYNDIPLPSGYTPSRGGRTASGSVDDYEAARDALLQFNLMVRRGIEPDALLYTSLIRLMGRAGLEWQAYKLFSRMVEANVRPLPETYVALRDATDPSRQKLREDIQAKLEEAVQRFPGELAEDELARRRQEDAECWRLFEASLQAELPAPTPEEVEAGRSASSSSSTTTTGTTEIEEEAGRAANAPSEPLGTVHIRHPRDVWNTAELVETLRQDEKGIASGDRRESLRAELEKLHEEELRIFLTIHRQLRHGTASQLIDRILRTVSEERVRAMLQRRRHYFRSVESLLKNDMEALQREKNGGERVRVEGVIRANEREEAADGLTATALSDPPLSPLYTDVDADTTTTSEEKHVTAPDVLYTPWGFLRKPRRAATATTTFQQRQNVERLVRLQLTEEELTLLRHKAEGGDLDEVPELLLRRYAYQFQLRWRRRRGSGDPQSLLETVAWHLTTFFSLETTNTQTGSPGQLGGADLESSDNHVSAERAGSDGNPSGDSVPTPTVVFSASPPPTPALRRQRELQGLQRTLDQYEAFRVMAQRAQNLQVVDHKEINLHLHTIQRERNAKERKAAEWSRREGHLMAAAALAKSAVEYDGPSVSVSSASSSGDVGGGTGMEERPFAVLGLHTPNPATTEADEEEDDDDNSPHSGVGDTVTDGDRHRHHLKPSSPIHHQQQQQEENQGQGQKEVERGEEEEEEEELPPWALTAGEDEFDLSTGRFGSPELGRFRELSDSKVRLLPQRAAQRKWRVDHALLPASLQDSVREARRQEEQRHAAVEAEYQRRSRYASYRKWDKLLDRAQKKKKSEVEADIVLWDPPTDEEGSGDQGGKTAPHYKKTNHSTSRGVGTKPLPAPKRLAQLLRKGMEKQRVSRADQERLKHHHT